MTIRICSKCTVPKPLDQFPLRSKKKNTRTFICKICTSRNSKKWYEANKSRHRSNVRKNTVSCREELYSKKRAYLLEHPCVDCTEEDPIVLDFDHRDRRLKSYSIAVMITNCSPWESILKEISKCDVRCANCHRKRTHQQRVDEATGIQPVSSA